MEYVYAALMLHKLKKEITEENVTSIVKASGAELNEAKVKSLVASLADVDIEDAIKAAPVAAAALQQQPLQQKVEKAKKQKRKMKQQPANLKKQQWKVFHPYSANSILSIQNQFYIQCYLLDYCCNRIG